MNSGQRAHRSRTDKICQVSDTITSVTGRNKNIGNEEKGLEVKFEFVKFTGVMK